MKKRKKTIITITIAIVIILVSLIFVINLSKNNKENGITLIPISKEGKYYNTNKVTIKANHSIELDVEINNTTENVYNYGLFYGIENKNITPSYLSVGVANDKEASSKGSINQERLQIPLKITNVSNEEITITLGVVTSQFEIEYKKNEFEISNTYENIPNIPNLIDGMIPIYYDEGKKVWLKANETNENNNWYNYKSKKWANAVVIKKEAREQYLNASVGTQIKETDILAYYVWIPRYKYQLFNTEFEKVEEQSINIEFETSNKEKSNGTKNGEWLTHPAFTFGSDELTGFWVGKFETTGTAETPTIKPNLVTLTNQNVSEQFKTSQKFISTDYVSEEDKKNIDSHAAKNIEWGAIAYLTNSNYGVCTNNKCNDVRNNNVNTHSDKNGPSITGCAATTSSGNMVVSNSCITNESRPYNDVEYGVLASTTGSIYGIYDMNGGSWEITMATMKNNDNDEIIVGSYEKNSGYQGVIYDENGRKQNINGIELPNKKYYDIYIHNTDDHYYKFSKLGDATGETRGWYEDFNDFIISNESWFMRGGLYNHKHNDGIFAFGKVDGRTSILRGFRTVLINLKK